MGPANRNPRKFRDKIALQNKLQDAKDQEFMAIMQEVSGVKQSRHHDPSSTGCDGQDGRRLAASQGRQEQHSCCLHHLSRDSSGSDQFQYHRHHQGPGPMRHRTSEQRASPYAGRSRSLSPRLRPAAASSLTTGGGGVVSANVILSHRHSPVVGNLLDIPRPHYPLHRQRADPNLYAKVQQPGESRVRADLAIESPLQSPTPSVIKSHSSNSAGFNDQTTRTLNLQGQPLVVLPASLNSNPQLQGQSGSIFTGQTVTPGSIFNGQLVTSGSMLTGQPDNSGSIFTGQPMTSGSMIAGQTMTAVSTCTNPTVTQSPSLASCEPTFMVGLGTDSSPQSTSSLSSSFSSDVSASHSLQQGDYVPGPAPSDAPSRAPGYQYHSTSSTRRYSTPAIIVTEYKDCLAGGVAEEAVVTPSSTSFSSCYRDQRSASPLDPVDSGQPSPPQYSPAATGPPQAGSRLQLEEDNHHLVNRFNTIQIADYGQKGSLSGLGGCEEYMAGVNNPLSPPVSSVDIDNILERELQRLQGSNSNLNFIDQSFVHL